MNDNRKAFLSMIAHSEGTSTIPDSDDGYLALVGGTLFTSYADHPRKVVRLNSKLHSTAAGRYQILARYYDSYKWLLKLPDFSPESQDKIAIQLIRECHALEDIDAGRFDVAVDKCKSRWASFPNAGYSQHENNIDDLRLVYLESGGSLA